MLPLTNVGRKRCSEDENSGSCGWTMMQARIRSYQTLEEEFEKENPDIDVENCDTSME